MPYKSIQGPLVLSLALIALGAGAIGAPQSKDGLLDLSLSQVVSAASQQARTHDAEQRRADRERFQRALQPRGDAALAPIARELAQLRRFEPLRAGDLVTHSVDGADSTVALRGFVGNGAPLRYSLVQAPRHGRVTIERDRATYRPDPGFAGVDSYTYRVQAGGASAEAMVAVTAIRDRALPATAAAAL
ncbi:Ig-like domain-containing protein [Lysobacter enzymogenes]|uniref:Ig-like domain-containing protein n=1 Tax=Lysobacter enzymogenes TaxID=69 RepID=UPI0009C5554C|nr:Ig-like domain-containing protein [Lysobacter enzymogenes]UZW58840.1 Ig-like domain-containing protein [Lysobacter enzymogenes]